VSAPVAKFVNHYSVLDVDPKADLAAIEKAYRTRSAEFHPDNRSTGDAEKYQAVQTAYEVLSNPTTRADFDKLTAPVSEDMAFPAEEFVAGLGADSERRICLLCILYHRLKYNPISPALPLRRITEIMLISDVELEFNVWYLKKKGLLTTDDKSRLLITVAGIDYVESVAPTYETIQPVLRDPAQGEQAGTGTQAETASAGTVNAGEAATAADKDKVPQEQAAAEQRAPANPSSIAALSKVLAKLGNTPSTAKPLKVSKKD
jgi:hypothetical protein